MQVLPSFLFLRLFVCSVENGIVFQSEQMKNLFIMCDCNVTADHVTKVNI